MSRGMMNAPGRITAADDAAPLGGGSQRRSVGGTGSLASAADRRGAEGHSAGGASGDPSGGRGRWHPPPTGVGAHGPQHGSRDRRGHGQRYAFRLRIRGRRAGTEPGVYVAGGTGNRGGANAGRRHPAQRHRLTNRPNDQFGDGGPASRRGGDSRSGATGAPRRPRRFGTWVARTPLPARCDRTPPS